MLRLSYAKLSSSPWAASLFIFLDAQSPRRIRMFLMIPRLTANREQTKGQCMLALSQPRTWPGTSTSDSHRKNTQEPWQRRGQHKL